jgi:hypothetical protein
VLREAKRDPAREHGSVFVYIDRGGNPMRRAALLGILSGLAALFTVVQAASSPWTPVPDPYTDLEVPANAWGGACSFPIRIDTVANNERQLTTDVGPPAADGTTLTRVRGRLVVSVTNLDTGNTIVRDVSGPTDKLTLPDGTGIETEAGNNANVAGPISFSHTGEPVFFFTTGPVILTFSTTSSGTQFLTSFHALHQESACDLLTG